VSTGKEPQAVLRIFGLAISDGLIAALARRHDKSIGMSKVVIRQLHKAAPRFAHRNMGTGHSPDEINILQ
jgi:hypothetical protein